jgi:hypothetical protein
MTRDQKRSPQLVRSKPEISEILIDTIDTFLGEEKRPILIAVLRKDRELVGTLRQLADVATAPEGQEVLGCYTLDELLPYFMNRFGVGGTPTFLMILSGVITGTMLGRNETQAILHFIRQNLARYRKSQGKEGARHAVRPGRKAARRK